MDDIVTDHLSYSRLRSFQICSLKYFFIYVEKVKPAFTPGALAFGTAFHRVVEEALVRKMAGENPAIENLMTVFGKSLDKSQEQAPIRWSEKETRASVMAQAQGMIQSWISWGRPEARIVGVEEGFELELASWLPKLQGRVDFVEVQEDAVVLGDIKTSRTHWGDEQILQGQDQLVLYREGLRGLIEEIGKPVKLVWEIIGKVKTPWIERVVLPEPLPTTERPIRIASIVLEAIEKRVFLPHPGWQCLSCPFRGPCREW